VRKWLWHRAAWYLLLLRAAGLQEDCPFEGEGKNGNGAKVMLTSDTVEAVDNAAFVEYVGRLYQYLLVSRRGASRRRDSAR
jgi:hypothetical protein